MQRPNSNFCMPLKNNSEGFPSNQISVATMTSASEEKWRPFSCFYSRVWLRTYQHHCIPLRSVHAPILHFAGSCFSYYLIHAYVLKAVPFPQVFPPNPFGHLFCLPHVKRAIHIPLCLRGSFN